MAKEKRLSEAEDLKIIFPAKLGKYALKFTAAKYHHVNRGLVYSLNTTYGNFYLEYLVRILGDGYADSLGNGGNHILLNGFSGNEADGYFITGNVYNALAAAATSFSTSVSGEKVPHNVWTHIAICGDTDKLGAIINGVPSYFAPWDGVRRTSSGTYENIWMEGGSDHQNASMVRKAMRLFEGTLPYSNPFQNVVRPAVENMLLPKLASTTAAIIADYSEGSLKDFGNPFNGSLHHGFLASTLDSGAAGFSDQYSYNRQNLRDANDLPEFIVDEFSSAGGTAAQKTQIASSRIYYDASGADVNYLTRDTLGGLTTRIGNKTWSNANYGQQNGAMFCNSTSPGLNIITDTATDGTIIFRKPTSWFPLGISAVYQIIFRYIDANNYNFLYVDEYGSGYIFTVVSGSQTNTGSFTFGTGWTEAKLVISGTTVTTYKDGVQKDSKTVSANSGGTGKGWMPNSPLLKMSEFAVI